MPLHLGDLFYATERRPLLLLMERCCACFESDMGYLEFIATLAFSPVTLARAHRRICLNADIFSATGSCEVDCTYVHKRTVKGLVHCDEIAVR